MACGIFREMQVMGGGGGGRYPSKKCSECKVGQLGLSRSGLDFEPFSDKISGV